MIVVTGASGMLGSQVLIHLAEEFPEHDLHAWYRSESSKACALKQSDLVAIQARIKWVRIDLMDALAVEEAMAGAEYVVHSAAMVSFRASHAQTMLTQNPGMAENVAAAALHHGVKNVVHVSSVAALGKPADGSAISESDQPQRENLNTYGQSKYDSELVMQRYHEEGMPLWIVNPTVIVGPDHWPGGSSQLVNSIRNGLKFYTPGSTGWVKVENVASAVVKLLAEAPGQGENFLLNDKNASFKDAFADIAADLGVPAPKHRVSPGILQIAWRVERLLERLFGRAPSLTKDSVRASCADTTYDNSKALAKKLIGNG